MPPNHIEAEYDQSVRAAHGEIIKIRKEVILMICPIYMENVKDVQKVSNIAAQSGIDMTISCGTIAIDPRSILGLFALMGRKVLLVAPDNTNPTHFMSLVKKMGVAA